MSKSSKGHIVGYIRVSSEDQATDRQQQQLNSYGVDKIFTDKLSGKDTNRPELLQALGYVRHGDTLAVHSLDRLARNLADLLGMVEDLTKRGVIVHFIKENLTFRDNDSDPFSKLMLQMLGAFAQFERSLIRERQREGIAIAKQAGIYKGRKQVLSPEQEKELLQTDSLNNGKSRSALATKFGISRKTLYRYLDKHETQSAITV